MTLSSFKNSPSKRGGPLMMLVLVFGLWISGRAVLWENPFPLELPSMETFFAEADRARRIPMLAGVTQQMARTTEGTFLASALSGEDDYEVDYFASYEQPFYAPSTLPFEPRNSETSLPIIAAGHQFLMAAAFSVDLNALPGASPGQSQASPSPAMPLRTDPRAMMSFSGEALDRWSLDAFAFYRAGSGSSSIAQGRAPVYGASQASANLQYRLAPRSAHDPRAYVRAYRAFVAEPENEIALGVSARPLADIPLRTAAELRVTQGPFGTDLRPAAYAVTELAPQSLPLGTQLEAYGGAGYVGGAASTPFVDGQIAITRQLREYAGINGDPVRFSLGAAAWGGAQDKAGRLDVGPTLRLDVSVGDVPARLSVDWRERVAGEAEPGSGIAATLSTRF